MTKLTGIIRITKSTGEVYEHRMHSFVQNFAYLLNSLCARLAPNGGVGLPMKDTANTSVTAGACNNGASYYNWFYTAAAAIGIDTYGMVVGTGVTPVALTDYKLDVPIAQGAGAGQMKYSAASYQVGKISSGANRSYKLIRFFANDSGGAITVKEVGFIARPYNHLIGQFNILICRDVLGAPVTVNSGEGITVEMAFRITA